MTTPPEEKKPEKERIKTTQPLFGGGITTIRKNFINTIAYIVLSLSLLYACFDAFSGGLVAGFIMGLYFSAHTVRLFQKFQDFLIEEGIFKSFVLIAAIAAFIISAPGLALGLFLGAGIRTLFKIGTTYGNTEPPEQTKK